MTDGPTVGPSGAPVERLAAAARVEGPAVTPRAERPAVTARASVASAAAMRLLGKRLAGLLRRGDLVVLAGELGAGKTTLAAGIGEGLDVRGPVTSPTFVIARMHPSLGSGPDLVHADAYRLGSRLEVDDLDLDGDVDHAVTVVEWGEGLVENLASGHLRVTIDRPGPSSAFGPDVRETLSAGSDDEVRQVTAAGYGARWEAVAGQLEAVLAEAR
jgi:tRNA threonylcarbamoyladenosine biosynthesis protein TsaE